MSGEFSIIDIRRGKEERKASVFSRIIKNFLFLIVVVNLAFLFIPRDFSLGGE